MRNITVEIKTSGISRFYTMRGESQKEVEQYIVDNKHEFQDFLIDPKSPLVVIPHEEGFSAKEKMRG